ncbi:MAG: ABC transporter substrate-binding protein [Propionibacteriaceae bacterium]
MRFPRPARWAAVVLAATLTVTACGGGGDEGDGDTGEKQPLTIHANSANSYQPNFNPFSATANQGTRGMLYEPLLASTPMTDGEAEPWLAEEMIFNDDGTKVTFTLREGVTWSDGEAFDADDVAFTFQLMTDNPATNTGALDLAGAKKISATEVEVSFNSAAFAFEAAIGNVVVVPEHVFADVNPVEFQNEEPVATGAFTLGEFSQQLYTFTKNPDYWKADEVEVEEVRYPANTEQTFTTALQSGELDWSGGFVANIDDIYVKQDPEHRGYWYPGGGLTNLVVNLEKKPFDDPVVRQAFSAAMNRDQLSETAMQGYTPPSHPTGLPLPAYESAVSEEYADATLAHDAEEASRLLDEAGYAKGPDGIRTTPDGDKMSYEVAIPSSYVDWVTITQLLQEQFKEIGVEIVPQGVSFESWLETRNAGTFDVTMASVAIGLSPFDMFRSIMSSEYLDEDSVRANFSRYDDERADQALQAYAGTDDEGKQQAALDELQTLMVEDLPVIPMLQAPNWFQYNTARWEGFPTEDNAYALGAPFQFPDNMLVVQELTPAGS